MTAVLNGRNEEMQYMLPMKVSLSLILLCAVSSCSLVTVPVKTAGAIVTTTVKTTGTIVTAPFGGETEEDREEREAREKKRKREEVRRVNTYYADPAPYPLPGTYGEPPPPYGYPPRR